MRGDEVPTVATGRYRSFGYVFFSVFLCFFFVIVLS